MNNRLTDTGFSYDASGNMLTDGTNTYTYDAENLLTAAGVTYTYDGDGDRVQKSSGKLYWYGAGSDALDETDGSGNLTDEYIFFGGKRIARRDSSSNVDYYFADHLGSARVITNSSGTILDDSDFTPFGVEMSHSSGSGNRYKFTGKERDSESGLDNFTARSTRPPQDASCRRMTRSTSRPPTPRHGIFTATWLTTPSRCEPDWPRSQRLLQ